MQANQTNRASNVVPFTRQPRHGWDDASDQQHDKIIRLLDLSKFERPRPPGPTDNSMRANIAAMVLLGLLVFLGKDVAHKFERSSLCPTKSECIY